MEVYTSTGNGVVQLSTWMQTVSTILEQKGRAVSSTGFGNPSIVVAKPMKVDTARTPPAGDDNDSLRSYAVSQPESQPGIVAFSDVQAESQFVRADAVDEDEIDELWESQSQSQAHPEKGTARYHRRRGRLNVPLSHRKRWNRYVGCCARVM